MSDWQVGQKVIISDTQNRVHDGEVVKIARKYIYVQWARFGNPDRFDMITGSCAESRYGYGYGCQVYTVTEHARNQRQAELEKKLRENGVELHYRAKLSVDQLEAIARIVFEEEQ
jgi:hypothetical protein